jgi:2-C-methyl-D-erythritol 4-phosphate cytidylyltransferase
MKEYAIIVAGGSGSRMKTDIPKQFLPIEGKAIILHTLEKFGSYSPAIQIILVLPAKDIEYWQQLSQTYSAQQILQQFDTPPITAIGGYTRFQSVRNGLSCILENNALVAIHDGVRPYISPQIIRESFRTAEALGSAIVSVPCKDSVRVVEPNGDNQSIDRSKVRLIQTPQTFQVSLIKKAFETIELPTFTDDASVAEYAGFKIHLIEGSYENIKITTPDDMR